MTFVRNGNRFQLAVRRPWEMSRLRYSLYAKVRKSRGLFRSQIANEAGISYAAWRYRELNKEQYRIGELLALKDISNLDWAEFGKLIESCV